MLLNFLASSTTSATSTTCTATVPPQPQYSYHDINVYSLGGLAPHITLNPTVSISAPVGWDGCYLCVLMLKLDKMDCNSYSLFRFPCSKPIHS